MPPQFPAAIGYTTNDYKTAGGSCFGDFSVMHKLNGRKPQLMIDPNVNLAAQPLRTDGAGSWIVPLTEPMRSSSWAVPIEQWREHAELPEFKFMKRLPQE